MRHADAAAGIFNNGYGEIQPDRILGDRLRMSRHALDAGVFIRSMGTRGAAGADRPLIDPHHRHDDLARGRHEGLGRP